MFLLLGSIPKIHIQLTHLFFNLLVSPSSLLIIYPHSGVELTSWNAIIGQNLEVLIRNIDIYEIEAYILPNSSWINVNVSKFVLAPSQEIKVLFSISDSIYPEVNGSIEIFTIVWVDRTSSIRYLSEPISIPVYVLNGKNLNETQSLLSQLLTVGLLFSIIISCVIVYFRREDIRLTIQNKINSFTNNPTSNNQVMTTHWESVQSKWSPILPEREMDILELMEV